MFRVMRFRQKIPEVPERAGAAQCLREKRWVAPSHDGLVVPQEYRG
jgi:hypothetical protein